MVYLYMNRLRILRDSKRYGRGAQNCPFLPPPPPVLASKTPKRAMDSPPSNTRITQAPRE
ncbi:hypothetical protein DFAR_1930015 [Desulfarculales bacterium]